MTDRTDQFDEAMKTITEKRGAVYDHPKQNFARIADYWSVLFGVKIEPWQVPLAMILVKTARLQNTPDHLDGWLDLGGYARTGVMVTDP